MFTSMLFKSQVSRSTHACIFLMKDLYPVITLRIIIANQSRMIFTAIIY